MKTHRYGRKPTPHVCTCKATILTAWNADQAAYLVHLDPYALTPQGETWAITENRQTYKLNTTGIHIRDQFNRPRQPPSDTLIVLAAHVCGSPVPAEFRLKRSKPSRPPVVDPNVIPF